MKNVPTNLKNSESKVYKLDVDKLLPVTIDLSKLSDVVKMMLLKKMYVKLRKNILNIKDLTLLTYLLKLLLMLK